MANLIDLRERGYMGRKPFRVDYIDAFGQRKRPHFKSKAEADRFRVTIEAEILKAKEGLLPDWFVANNVKKKDLTIGELYGEYLERKIELKAKESAQASAKRLLDRVIKRFSEKKASQLTPHDIDAYHIEWLKQGKKESSFQRKTGGLKTMLSWGVTKGLVLKNPLERYTFEEKAKAAEKEALDEEQIKLFIRILREKRPGVLDYLILGVNTGMRIAEMWSLEWSQVDIEKRTIRLPEEKTKTNEARTIPLNHACMDVISRLYVKKEYAPFVLWHPSEPTGVSKEVGNLSTKFLGKRHTPHHWRVTFATLSLRGKRIKAEDGRVYWVRGDLKTVAEIGGWKPNSAILATIYQKVSEEQKRETVDLINVGEADILPAQSVSMSLDDTDTRQSLTINV
jgi:integrase